MIPTTSIKISMCVGGNMQLSNAIFKLDVAHTVAMKLHVGHG